MVKRVLLFLGAVSVLTLILWGSQRRHEVERFSGFIEADEIRLGSRVGGRVAAVRVEEGTRVAAGDVLVELEPYDIRERLAQAAAQRAESEAKWQLLAKGYRVEEVAQAEARVRQFQSELEKLEAGPRAQELKAAAAEVELAQSEFELATKRFERAETMFGRQAISREDYDTASTELRVARSRVQVKTESLAVLQEGSRQEDIRQAAARVEEAKEALNMQRAGYRSEELAAAKAALDAAQAAEGALQRQVQELRITAPMNGVMEAIELQSGDLVGPSAPALSMIDLSHLWVRAYIPENRLGIKLDDLVDVTVDSFPDQKFTGRISYIARQAEFTPRNIQTPEERSKQVFRIKVRLVDGLDVLRPGMSADVWLREGSGK